MRQHLPLGQRHHRLVRGTDCFANSITDWRDGARCRRCCTGCRSAAGVLQPGAGRGGGRGGPPASGPIGYSVQVSDDGNTWGTPVAQGAGQTPTTTIAFTPVTAKFIRITQTGTASGPEVWGIARVTVLRVDK